MARRLKPSWIPTPLSPDAERRPVPIAGRAASVRWRAWSISARALWLAMAYAARLLTGTLDRPAFYARVRRAVETTGGLWIKAAQLLSLRVDVLPVPLCHELASLQAQAPGFSPALAREIVERELGAPVDVFFDRWDDAPIAAASIGQVHRARLRREQAWVAVKVQKPYVEGLFARDLAIVRRVAAALRRLRLFPYMKWDDGARELQQIMKEELDFGYEASMTRRMRRLLRPHGVYVPKVFARYSTPRVLVAELIPAVFMAEYIRVGRDDPPRLERWLAENDVNPRRVGRRLAWSLHRQMLEDNLFHGDMHPGNIALLRGSRVALIDFGTTNFTDAEYLRTFDLFSRAVAAGQHAKAADMALLLCARLPVIDTQLVREHLVRVLRGWNSRTLVRELPYHDRSLNTLTLEVMSVLLGFRCHMEWAWLRLHRAIATLDASLIHLHPRIDYRSVMARYLAEADARRRRRVLTPATARRALTAVARLPDVQVRVREYAMFQTPLIRRQAQRFRGVARRVSSATAALLGIAAFAVLLQTAATVALVLRTAAGAPLDAVAGSQLSTWLAGLPRLEPQPGALVLLLDVWILLGIHRLRRELTRRDVDLRRHAAAG